MTFDAHAADTAKLITAALGFIAASLSSSVNFDRCVIESNRMIQVKRYLLRFTYICCAFVVRRNSVAEIGRVACVQSC